MAHNPPVHQIFENMAMFYWYLFRSCLIFAVNVMLSGTIEYKHLNRYKKSVMLIVHKVYSNARKTYSKRTGIIFLKKPEKITFQTIFSSNQAD